MSSKNKAKGTAFETKVRRAFGGGAIRMGGVGQPDIIVKDDAGELFLSIECERSKRNGLKRSQASKLAQAHRLRRSGTTAIFVAQHVGTPGVEPEVPYVLLELNDLIDLLAGRLEAP